MEKNQRHLEAQSFMKGAVFLGAAGLLVRLMGATFRIPLNNLLTPEEVSYYQSAYPIYIFFMALATAGFPAAIAKLVSEQLTLGQETSIPKTLRIAKWVMSSIGLIGSLILFFGAPYISSYIENDLAVHSFRALAPAIFFVSIMSVYRGFFQGVSDLSPYALSQVVEQLGRVVIGLGLAITLLKYGGEIAAAGATFGASAGAVLGLILIYFLYKIYQKKNRDIFLQNSSTIPGDDSYTIFKRLLSIAIPITLGAVVMPLMNSIDAAMVMKRLHSIGMGEQAPHLFGMLGGYAATIVNLPQVLTAAIQVSIIPVVTSYYASSNKKQLHATIEGGIRTGMVISLPCAIGIVTLAVPIMELLYPRQAEFASDAGQILFFLGFGVFFLGMYQVTTGILQGLNLQKRPAIHLAIAALIKVTLTFTLVAIPWINIYGAAISTVTAYALAMTLNVFCLKKHVQMKFDLKSVVLKPLISVMVMAVFVKGTHLIASFLISGRLATLLAIFVGVIAYAYMLLATNTLTETDFAMIPGGSKVKKLKEKLQKFGLMRK